MNKRIIISRYHWDEWDKPEKQEDLLQASLSVDCEKKSIRITNFQPLKPRNKLIYLLSNVSYYARKEDLYAQDDEGYHYIFCNCVFKCPNYLGKSLNVFDLQYLDVIEPRLMFRAKQTDQKFNKSNIDSIVGCLVEFEIPSRWFPHNIRIYDNKGVKAEVDNQENIYESVYDNDKRSIYYEKNVDVYKSVRKKQTLVPRIYIQYYKGKGYEQVANDMQKVRDLFNLLLLPKQCLRIYKPIIIAEDQKITVYDNYYGEFSWLESKRGQMWAHEIPYEEIKDDLSKIFSKLFSLPLELVNVLRKYSMLIDNDVFHIPIELGLFTTCTLIELMGRIILRAKNDEVQGNRGCKSPRNKSDFCECCKSFFAYVNGRQSITDGDLKNPDNLIIKNTIYYTRELRKHRNIVAHAEVKQRQLEDRSYFFFVNLILIRAYLLRYLGVEESLICSSSDDYINDLVLIGKPEEGAKDDTVRRFIENYKIKSSP